jgi:hypothetical protein
MSRTGKGKYPLRYILVSKREQLHLDDYPSFHASGSVSGMRKQFYGDEALLVRCGSYIYNVSRNPELYWEYAHR